MSESPRSSSGFAQSPAALIVICVVGLLIVGLPVLFSATTSFEQGPFYYLIKQAIGIGAAVVLCLVVSRLDLEGMRRHVWILGIAAVVALVLTAIPGVGVSVNGSRRWLGLGPVRVQASEFAKLAMVFCLAHYLAINQTRITEFKRGYVLPLGLIGLFAGLVLLQPDFGTAALTVAVGLILLFLAGARWLYILPTVGAAVAGFAVLVMNNANRLHRFTAFLDVEGNKLDGTYQLYQSLAAFAVGGVHGAGIGQGRQQINFLPEAHTDFIFAVMGEEMGLWFTLGVVVTFAVIFLLGLLHLRRAPNLFQFLLVAGAVLLVTMQAMINLGVVTGLLPTKGMSLPFISAGLSNLLLMGLLVGVIINSARNWAKPALHRRKRTMEEVVA
ncbi:FtsW/RodA/SpoVE family cell cycle protein [Synoicihabitans lomoniglobus]|uniref:Probable peptidoglycan glycosyltransferase FtsW n=1 Tax=Synoicihabitans lomoniglobus TaxID=2909285 RepID=A0AAF0CQJ0_9BACT|nr:putative lipid II flippase FtsW [Opitutaceae bacterium LMO-M01]WED66156.1 putative peptidoglycan glycosyltransferase FtsW [Opitutaceae bacterium LMO-M01]